MCEEQFEDRKISKDLMFMLRLNESTAQLAIANSVLWNCSVLRERWSCPNKGIGL